ncbi:MAG: PIG-L family deacetylase [Nanoarchaeota archaeon]|nr:PIG-L family deacetylase [Nanoarchaeota archaeon]
MTVLVCAAHADDEVIGCGATIAKLAKTEKVIVVIFSYGSGEAGSLLSWPPFMSEEELRRKRILESKKACSILGVSETIFLGIIEDIENEFDFEKREKLLNIIKKYKPSKIFYHSAKDAHPHHIAVNKIMNEIISKLDYKPEVFKFQINLFDFGKKEPTVIIDVSKEFPLKMKALSCFKSQILSIYLLEPLILLKGIIYGRRHGFKYAEYFYGE